MITICACQHCNNAIWPFDVLALRFQYHENDNSEWWPPPFSFWLRAFGRMSTIKIWVNSHNRAFRVSIVFPIEAMRRRTRRKIGYQWSPLADEWEKRIAEAIFSSLVFSPEFRFIYRVFGSLAAHLRPFYRCARDKRSPSPVSEIFPRGGWNW